MSGRPNSHRLRRCLPRPTTWLLRTYALWRLLTLNLRSVSLLRVQSFTPRCTDHALQRSYPALFADTSQADLTLMSVMTGEDQNGIATVSFWFHLDWRLPSGAAAPFDAVDVASLSPDGKIQELHIIYDTVDVRPAFQTDVGRSSWRRSNL